MRVASKDTKPAFRQITKLSPWIVLLPIVVDLVARRNSNGYGCHNPVLCACRLCCDRVNRWARVCCCRRCACASGAGDDWRPYPALARRYGVVAAGPGALVVEQM